MEFIELIVLLDWNFPLIKRTQGYKIGYLLTDSLTEYVHTHTHIYTSSIYVC